MSFFAKLPKPLLESKIVLLKVCLFPMYESPFVFDVDQPHGFQARPYDH